VLDTLFNKHGCDKSSKHNYHLVYEKDFSCMRDEPINILELGVFRGDSIKAWLEYFPKAQIYGLDIFVRESPEDIEVLNDERVHWIRGDSLSEDIANKIQEEWNDVTFDIIIDDGKHTPDANRLSFKHLNKFLSKSGAYYVEDVWPLDIMTEQEMKHHWVQKYPEDYTVDEMLNFLQEIETWDVERFDLRAGAEPDSYIIKIKEKVK